ncbi:MAG: hypothetical protein KBD19_02110 [Candidatus Moranbacteria bacterium]|nr:hypothetical protein [Candidatus Moranbacteria bacterium]
MMDHITSIDDFEVGMDVECFYDGKLLDNLRVVAVYAGAGSEKPSVELKSVIASPGNTFRFSDSMLFGERGYVGEWLHIREGLFGEDSFSWRELPYTFRKHER